MGKNKYIQSEPKISTPKSLSRSYLEKFQFVDDRSTPSFIAV
jgi:hypothetical protein